MAPFAVDRPFDIAREVGSLAANPAIGMPVKVAVFVFFEPEVKDFDRPLELVVGRTGRSGARRRRGGSPRGGDLGLLGRGCGEANQQE